MKLIILLILVGCLQVTAKGKAQRVTIEKNNVSLESVFKEIEKQTGFVFLYKDDIFKKARPVSIAAKNASLDDALILCFRDQPLHYKVFESTIVVKIKDETVQPINDLDAFITITGRVTDEQASPLTGVNVQIKSTHTGTQTDSNGEFSLSGVTENSVLEISYIGYQKQEMPVGRKIIFNIQLKLAENKLDEALIVAYNTTTRRANTAAVTTVKGDDVKDLPVRSFEKALQGQVPGLYISLGNGQPGGGSSNIVLRGIATATGGGARQPLFVVDGVPVTAAMTQASVLLGTTQVTNPLSQLNIGDIESYTVLKDAAAIALYGAKASNGVILLTTKKGKAGKTVFSFHHQTDIARPINNNVELLDQQQYLELLRESYKNANPANTDAVITADLRKKFPLYVNSPGDSSFYAAPDWYGAIFRNNAITTDNQFSASGGSGDNTFYFNAAYLKQEGVARKSGFERVSVRYNFANRSSKWLTVGLNSTFSFTRQDYPVTSDAATAAYGFPFIVSPLNPVYLQSGSYYLNPFGVAAGTVVNPLAILDYNINRGTNFRGLGDAYAEIKFSPALKFRTDIGGDLMLANEKIKTDLRLPGTYQNIGFVSERDALRTRWITINTLRYENIFAEKHQLNLVAGQEAQRIFSRTISAARTGFSLPTFEEVSAGSTVNAAAGTSGKEALYSFFAQTNYGFNNRYFLSASARRDGSSKFGINNRYGNYWSLGAGWEITKESFIKDNFSWIGFLKLRGSVGTAGNADALSATSRYTTFTLGSTYAGSPTATINYAGGNDDLKWEELRTEDIGMEFRLFNGRVDGTLDWYRRKTSRLIYLVNPPSTTGIAFYSANIGSMLNRGLEASLNFGVISKKNFTWNLQVNWSTNQNKLVKADQPTSFTGNLIRKEGEPFNSFYLVRWAGVNSANGAPQWYDDKGAITSTYNAQNATIVGKPTPDGFGGITNSFRYKSLELTAFLYYQYGFEVYDAALASLLNDGNVPYVNQSVRALNRWQKPGDIAENPVRKLNNSSRSNQPSTRYLFDGDFIRLKNVNLSYRLPAALVNKIKLNGVRVYAQGSNLALRSKFKGLDPELVQSDGNASFAYPLARTFSLGIDVTF